MFVLRVLRAGSRWRTQPPVLLRVPGRRPISLFSKREKIVELEKQIADNPDDLYMVDIYLQTLNEDKYYKYVVDFVRHNKQYLKSDAVLRSFILASCHTGDIYSLEIGKDSTRLSRRYREILSPFYRKENPLKVTVVTTNPFISAILATLLFFGSGLLVSLLFTAIFYFLLPEPVRKQMGSNSFLGVLPPSSSSSSSSSLRQMPSKSRWLVEQPISTRLSDIKGIDEIKDEVQFIIHYLQNPSDIMKSGASIPHGVLLSGPPGCGKTLIAKALAGEAGVPFFYTTGSEFDEMFVGMGAQRLRELFREAKRTAPCIVFIDEFDAVGGKRQSGPLARAVDHMTINQLLTEMDGFNDNEGIIVIAATNIPTNLDSALTRSGRFDLKLDVPLPDLAARIDLLRKFTDGKRLSEDLNLEQFARNVPGATGADLENIINQSLLMMAIRREEILTSEILNDVYEKVLFGKARTNQILPRIVRETTAYHEAGHALVSLSIEGSKAVRKATIIPRGPSLGMVSYHLEEEDLYQRTKQNLKADLLTSVAGRVSEELRFGRDGVTTGASSDFRNASNIARKMVMLYGMNRRHGLECIDEDSERYVSPGTLALIDEEVKRLLHDAEFQAKEILLRNYDALEEIAQGLLQKETLLPLELKEIIEHHGVEKEVPIPE